MKAPVPALFCFLFYFEAQGSIAAQHLFVEAGKAQKFLLLFNQITFRNVPKYSGLRPNLAAPSKPPHIQQLLSALSWLRVRSAATSTAAVLPWKPRGRAQLYGDVLTDCCWRRPTLPPDPPPPPSQWGSLRDACEIFTKSTRISSFSPFFFFAFASRKNTGRISRTFRCDYRSLVP